jgi:SAM-dependent methyltransferase
MQETESRAELRKQAHERLYPSIRNPNYLVLRRRRLIFRRWIESLEGEGLSVLDVGGRLQPYRPLIEHRVKRYVALDVLRTPLVDVIGSGEQLPFRDESFDVVFATAVFEWFPEPRVAALQVHRVLKPGGYLMMSVASVYPRIRDEEYWRFLPAGLKFVLAPFSEVEIVPEVRSIGGYLRVTASALSIFVKYNWVRWVLHSTVVPVLNVMGLGLEGLGISSNDQVAGNYSVLAKK